MKKLLLASAISVASVAAQAEYAAELGYASLDDDGISLGAIYIAGAYEFDTDNSYTNSIELTLGKGISDKVVGTTAGFGAISVEIDYLYSIAYRGSYDFSNGAYAFFTPSYSKVSLSGSSGGISASASSDWELGIGVGAGYKFSDSIKGELQYDSIDSADVISAGIRFSF